jgi:hypothetical protein
MNGLHCIKVSDRKGTVNKEKLNHIYDDYKINIGNSFFDFSKYEEEWGVNAHFGSEKEIPKEKILNWKDGEI